jgi:hypothetical protein
MKKYFAKYLPVEGEINEGDKAINLLSKELVHVFAINAPKSIGVNVIAKAPVNRTEKWLNIKNLKKIKLFLCSKDIQVGEEITYLNANDGYTNTILGDEEQKQFFLKQIEVFKVVGEISSEATWVLEEDQFNNDEIDKIYFDTERNYGDIEYIKIKGPCNHFH